MNKILHLDCTLRDGEYYNNLKIQLKYFKNKKNLFPIL